VSCWRSAGRMEASRPPARRCRGVHAVAGPTYRLSSVGKETAALVPQDRDEVSPCKVLPSVRMRPVPRPYSPDSGHHCATRHDFASVGREAAKCFMISHTDPTALYIAAVMMLAEPCRDALEWRHTKRHRIRHSETQGRSVHSD
jgi:hypothetical protein